MRINTNKNPPIEWFNLHAPMDDGSGYCAYADNWKGRLAQLANLQGWRRGAFGIHPGARSLGCVTISPQEWASVRDYIKGGTLMYQPNSGQQQTFCGYLVVTDD
uniref:DUF2778 domain-containing protein n=1 Tax=Tetradesmus obliquus TaxID=3088 RepID=A0A383WCX2_TETOB